LETVSILTCGKIEELHVHPKTQDLQGMPCKSKRDDSQGEKAVCSKQCTAMLRERKVQPSPV